MSSKPEPAIWSRDSSQRFCRHDSCQLNIIWMSNIKDITVEPLLTDTSLIRTVHLVPGKCSYILCKNNLYNHKNYNFLACDWFKKVLFSTNSIAKLLSDSLLLDSLLLDSLLSDSSISQSHSKM